MTPTSPDLGAVLAALRRAGDVQAAAETVVDTIVAAGLDLPSVYLERGGRLRCTAQRGYWHVYDGLAPGAGVLGTTFATGTASVLRAPQEVAHYIRAIPDAVAEVCLPLRLGGRVVGVLNVESRRPVDDDTVAWLERLAEAFGTVLAELGGPPGEEPAEALARIGSELAAMSDAGEVAEHAVRAARAVSGMSSAALFPEGALVSSVVRAGPLGEILAGLPQRDVDQLAGYVAQATSSYAVGDEDGDGFEATRALRARGVRSLVVLALVARGRRQGILVLADEAPRGATAALVAGLEVLAATAAAMLAAAGDSAALVRSQRAMAHQASHDPLTGLANRTQLLAAMAAQLGDDRARRRLVVLFVDLDGFKEVNDRFGHRAGDQLLVAVADRLRHAARSTDLVGRIGGDEFIVLCSGVDAVAEATAVADRVLERLAAPWYLDDSEVRITACIGVATAAGGSTVGDAQAAADELLCAADRAMYAAKRAGAGTWRLDEGTAGAGHHAGRGY